MKIIFLSISLANRKNLDGVVATVERVINRRGASLIVFVDKYKFEKNQEKLMMRRAASDIKNSAVLIAEVSKKAIGVGVEVGYAAALNIPVIYIRNVDSEYSSTVGGISNYEICYSTTSDLENQLFALLQAELLP